MSNIMTIKEIRKEEKIIVYDGYELLDEKIEYEVYTGNETYKLLIHGADTTILKKVELNLYKAISLKEIKLFYKHLNLTMENQKLTSADIAGSFNYLAESATIETTESRKLLMKITETKE